MPSQMIYHARLVLAVIIVLFTSTACASNNSTILEAFPQLFQVFPNLEESPPQLNKKYTYGRQDMDKCCSRAVFESLLQRGDGTLELADPSFIGNDLDNFRGQQYPCEAHYIGDRSGAPPVTITYRWCSTNCPGWQRSSNIKLNQWVLPVLGFIIPAVVFCLAVPRRRKIQIWDELFNVPLNAVTSAPRTPFIALLAAVIVSGDTILWLMTIFALAGPILISGIYEASIDSRILSYLQEKIRNGKLSTAQRSQLMYVILVGNLDMLASSPDGDDHDAPWTHVNGPGGLLENLDNNRHQPLDIDSVISTKTRLRTMLAVQYSFGVTVGAPVVFFSGSFLYTLLDNYSHLGDNDTSHALAFGMWFMTVPHIAIVSGLLLAGNNPNTLEGIAGKQTAEQDALKWGFLTWVYDSRYHPAWIWDRGRSKKIWALRTCHDSSTAPEHLRDVLHMGINDWTTIAACAAFLIVVPSALAFLTSFYTPAIGLSCRSMTFLLYMLCQLWLILLWIWNIESTALDDRGVPQIPVTRFMWTLHPQTADWQAYVWYPQAMIASGISIFTGIGGTLMQIIGVYRNCLCNIPMSHWGHSRYTTEFVISTNSAEMIYRAATVWKGAGAAAITFLGIVSFVGWWYQKRLRYQFKLMISYIDDNAETFHAGPANGRPHQPNGAPTQPNGAPAPPPGGP